MRNKGKVLALMLSAAALVAASVFGTMAYLTDKEAVTNTFTVGRVGLSLDEAPVDANGDEIEGERVTENEYHLLPGHEYDKDPTVHIDEDSESCWVFVTITNGLVKDGVEIEAGAGDDYTPITEQITGNGWTPLKDNIYYREWTKPATDEAEDDYYDLKVFEKFKIDGARVDNDVLDDFEGAKIIVNAYAVQKDGFTDVNTAWSVIEDEYLKTTTP